MDEVCSTHGIDGKYTRFYSVNLKGRDHLGDPGVGKRVILEWTLEN
jgi:hypothetical protein